MKYYVNLFNKFVEEDIIDEEYLFNICGTKKYMLFLKNGRICPETANSKDFDFRSLFDETKWIDYQINN